MGTPTKTICFGRSSERPHAVSSKHRSVALVTDLSCWTRLVCQTACTTPSVKQRPAGGDIATPGLDLGAPVSRPMQAFWYEHVGNQADKALELARKLHPGASRGNHLRCFGRPDLPQKGRRGPARSRPDAGSSSNRSSRSRGPRGKRLSPWSILTAAQRAI